MKSKRPAPLTIGYFGDGPWAHEALKLLLADEALKVVFVSPRFINPDPVLISMAEDAGIPVLRQQNVNLPESIEKIRSFGPRLLVSMSYDQIIRKALLDAAPLGFINCHAGRLPFYRGRNILNWALINGEKSYGITVHYIDQGIDTGDIIEQEVVPIRSEDDYGSILLDAQRRCARVLYRAVDKARRGRVRARVQAKIHPVGFYCGRRRPGDERIDWNWPSKRIHDFVRGISAPGPGARTESAQGELAVLKTQMIPRAPSYIGTPGEVVGRGDGFAVVKTGDTTLRLLSVAPVGADGTLGTAIAPALRIGDRLGLDLAAEVARLRRLVEELERRQAGSGGAA